MNIYILERIGDVNYDEFEGKVVVAKNSTSARKIANLNTADEGKIWTNAKAVSCRTVKTDHEHVVLSAFNAG